MQRSNNGLPSYQQTLIEIHNLHNSQSYNDALDLVEKTLTRGLFSSELFLLRGILIQLADKSTDTSLLNVEVASQSLETATLLAPNYIDPVLELAYLKYAGYINCAQEALDDFKRAEMKALLSLKSSLIGQLKCHVELKEMHEARLILEKLKELFPDDENYEILQVKMGEIL